MKQFTCRRVLLAQRNAPQVGIFIARNRLSALPSWNWGARRN
jgi:hypothetical protein